MAIYIGVLGVGAYCLDFLTFTSLIPPLIVSLFSICVVLSYFTCLMLHDIIDNIN
jgi:hypothetical protein